MLNLTNLNTHYGQAHILRDVSLHVGAGECVALLGRNGAGKSTTMKAIIGAVKASSGEIKYKDHNLQKLKNYRRARLGIGYVPEERRVFHTLTVFEHLTTGKQPPRDGFNPWTPSRIFELFPKLYELRNRQGGQLSGGEQQMLTVARTLMGNPECLLLDEPTEGLAPIVVQQVTDAIKILKTEGLAILLSEQNKQTAAALADRTYILEKGQIIYDGPIADITKKAHTALGW
ncbi:MAG: ABC transporter ATP-binding protein [Alphaproteobacteria bacterium]|nr:ABC transporter ATP-binding protein [Alphaproteobacteria bacterium]